MIETLKSLRRASSQALADTVRAIGETGPTEVDLRDKFQRRLSLTPGASTEGWYSPPPHGIILTVANPPIFARMEQPSYRVESAWPSPSEIFTDESILYCYSSQIHLATGLIGDIGCTLYRGSNQRVMSHLRRVWDVTMAIIDEAEIGMSFCDLYEQAGRLIGKSGFENNIYSVHDGSATNIGHTIPWSYEMITDDEADILHNGNPLAIADLVSNKRRFISATETLEITEGMAFTVEPRLSGHGVPTVSFHIVVAFDGPDPVVITEFDPLFEAFEMEGFQS